jgi:O-antigen ligase
MGRSPWVVVPRPLLAGIGLMGIGGLVGLLFADAPVDSGVLLGRLLVAAGLSLGVVLWWDPAGRIVRWLLGAFVVGAAVSAGLGALSATVLISVTDSWRDTIDRAEGLTGNANHLGAVSAIGVCLALGLAATTSNRLKVTAWLALAAVLGAGLLWSGSRSGLVGVAVGSLVVGWRLWTERRRTPVLVVAGAVGVVLLLAVVGVVRVPAVDRLLLRTDTVASTYSVESTEVRLELAQDRIEDADWSSLLVGAGMDNRDTTGGHSGHLEIWVGTGALGIGGWLLVCVTTLAPVAAIARRRGRLDARQAALLVTGAGFLTHLATTFFLEHIWDRYIWLLVALIAVLRPDAPEPIEVADEDEDEDGVRPAS